jgi:hypothetical protein
VLAVGSFTSPPFRSGVSFIPFHCIHYTILHSISSPFISPTSAPHSKSGSFIPLHLSTQFHSASRAFPNPQGSGVNKSYHCHQLTKAQSCSIPPKHTRSATFNRHLCFNPPHNEHRYALFFLRHIAPADPRKNIPFKL